MAGEKVSSNQAPQPTKTGRVWRRRTWKEMSPVQRVTNVVFGVVELILAGWALWDIRQRPAEQINGKKRTWLMASLIQPFGPLIYFIFGRKQMSIQPAS